MFYEKNENGGNFFMVFTEYREIWSKNTPLDSGCNIILPKNFGYFCEGSEKNISNRDFIQHDDITWRNQSQIVIIAIKWMSSEYSAPETISGWDNSKMFLVHFGKLLFLFVMLTVKNEREVNSKSYIIALQFSLVEFGKRGSLPSTPFSYHLTAPINKYHILHLNSLFLSCWTNICCKWWWSWYHLKDLWYPCMTLWAVMWFRWPTNSYLFLPSFLHNFCA